MFNDVFAAPAPRPELAVFEYSPDGTVHETTADADVWISPRRQEGQPHDGVTRVRQRFEAARA